MKTSARFIAAATLLISTAALAMPLPAVRFFDSFESELSAPNNLSAFLDEVQSVQIGGFLPEAIAVPEPASLVLVLAALVALGWILLRKKK